MNHLRSMTLERIITKAWTTDYRIHAGLWDHSYVSYVCFPFSFILSSRRQHVNTSCDGWIDGSSYVGYTHLVGEKIPYSTNLSSEDPSSTPNYRHRTLVVVSQYLYSQRTSSNTCYRCHARILVFVILWHSYCSCSDGGPAAIFFLMSHLSSWARDLYRRQSPLSARANTFASIADFSWCTISAGVVILPRCMPLPPPVTGLGNVRTVLNDEQELLCPAWCPGECNLCRN